MGGGAVDTGNLREGEAFGFAARRKGENNPTTNPCHDPGLNTDPHNIFFGFFFGLTPAEVIPDGNGGVLAAWTGGGNSEPELGTQAAHVSHFDASGGVTDYTVPLFAWNIIPEDPFFSPIFLGAMMLGENNVVFGSNGGRLEAFDQGSGIQKWSSLPDGFIFFLDSTASDGMNAYTKIGQSVNGLLSLDPFGALSFFPITTGISSLSYFDASTLLATTASGQGQMVSGLDSDFAPLSWGFPGGNTIAQRAPVPPQITYDKTIVKAGISRIGKDVHGIIKATITPKSSAVNVKFNSTNTARATVAEESRVDNANSTIVTLRINGITQTPNDKPQGDAQIQPSFAGGTTKQTVPILVIIPATQTHSVGPVNMANFAFPHPDPNDPTKGTTAIETDAGALVTITIFDQFGNMLDSIMMVKMLSPNNLRI
ncbi:MAG TPA: hypothetical protein VFK06_24860 [Candidatus Angelobacter sp.]|nr:hypothetical protein [Candidatus Angelobacter sp.]